jgi:hypothetical protein
MIIASNNEFVVPVGITSTRYAVIRLDDELSLMKDNAKKSKITNDILKTDLSKLASFLHKRDITNFKPTNIVKTDELIKQKIHALTLPNKWYLDMLTTGRIECKDVMSGYIDIQEVIPKKNLFECFQKSYAGKNHTTSVLFYKWLKSISLYKEVRPGGIRSIKFENIEILRQKWVDSTGDTLENWDLDKPLNFIELDV